MRTKWSHSSPTTERKLGVSRQAVEWIRRRVSAMAVLILAAPMAGCIACVRAMARWCGGSAPLQRIAVSWLTNNSRACGPCTAACCSRAARYISWPDAPTFSMVVCAGLRLMHLPAKCLWRRSLMKPNRVRKTTFRIAYKFYRCPSACRIFCRVMKNLST